jgi:lysozyme family protein
MGSFETCVAQTLDIEKGYVDNPNDAGGATNFGLSLRFLKKLADADKDGFVDGDIDKDGDVDIDDVKHLTLEDDRRILKSYFWDMLPMAPFEGQIKVQWKLFDIAVNCSPAQSIKILQRAVGVEADGLVGVKTLTAAKTMPEDTLLQKLSYHQLRYYNQCVWNRPANLAFLKGWTERADKQL